MRSTGRVEIGAEALLDLGADLGAQPKGEAALGEDLVIDGLVGQMNRVARERDRHIGHQVQPTDRGRQRQRREHVVRPLEGEDPGGTGVAQRPGPFDGIRRAEQRRHHLHVV